MIWIDFIYSFLRRAEDTKEAFEFFSSCGSFKAVLMIPSLSWEQWDLWKFMFVKKKAKKNCKKNSRK